MWLNTIQKKNLEEAAELLKKDEERIVTGSWLPLFPGFYNTLYEYDSTRAMEDLHEQIKDMQITDEEKTELMNLVNKKLWSTQCIYDDIENHNQQVAENFVSFVEAELAPAYFLKVELERIESPKEYNFSNDSIACRYTFSDANIETIKKFLADHAEGWAKYLKRHYKSCDGFMSWYDWRPDDADWQDIDECLTHSHKCGSIMQFIALTVLERNENDTYFECVTEDIYPSVSIEAVLNELEEKGLYNSEEDLTDEEKERRQKVLNERALAADKEQLNLFEEMER